jgi:hypothetical protein
MTLLSVTSLHHPIALILQLQMVSSLLYNLTTTNATWIVGYSMMHSSINTSASDERCVYLLNVNLQFIDAPVILIKPLYNSEQQLLKKVEPLGYIEFRLEVFS